MAASGWRPYYVAAMAAVMKRLDITPGINFIKRRGTLAAGGSAGRGREMRPNIWGGLAVSSVGGAARDKGGREGRGGGGSANITKSHPVSYFHFPLLYAAYELEGV